MDAYRLFLLVCLSQYHGIYLDLYPVTPHTDFSTKSLSKSDDNEAMINCGLCFDAYKYSHISLSIGAFNTQEWVF